MPKSNLPPKLITKKHIARQEKEAQQIRLIKIISTVVLAIVLGLLAYAVVDTQIIKPNRTVAQVGELKLTAKEFQQDVTYARINLINRASQYIQYAQMFSGMGDFSSAAQQIAAQLDTPQDIGRTTVNRMVDQVLIREEAAKRGISVSSAEVDQALEKAFGFFPNGTQTPTITPTAFATPTLSSTQIALVGPTATAMPTATQAAAEPTGQASAEETPAAEGTAQPATEAGTATPEPSPTLEPTITPTPTAYTTQIFGSEWSGYMASIKSFGVSEAFVRSNFENGLLREKMTAEITKDMEPFADQVWARHILVATEDEALSIIKDLKAGKDFKELAATFSTDPGSKDNGGDLGWFGKGRMVKEFEDAAFALENVGDISEPVQSVHGWHIIQLLGKGKNPMDAQSFETEKENFFNEWLKGIRDARTDIVINEDVWSAITPSTPDVPASMRQELINLLQPAPSPATQDVLPQVEPAAPAEPEATAEAPATK